MKLTYRPEIDGLRAVAVIGVILYHAQISINGFKIFNGGYIGVDIFFVISGYLITSIILKELYTTGNFSFKNFYERRVRRILPALILVMLVSLPFAWTYLLTGSFIDFSKSILYSLGFSSNFYFHYSGQLYDAENSLLKPFLHTWSLSVEEQFYIFFPIFLLIVFRYFKKNLLKIFIILFILSLLISEWGSRNYVSATFYLLHSRIWELIAGSILAYLELKFGHRSKNESLNLILPSTGVLLILYSFIFFDDKIFHPSFFTLIPVIGVCLIIWFSNRNEVITKILSTKIFVGTGLISYSLYLWHYPIFAFARIKGGAPSQFDKFEWIVLTFILSILSYFFVERFFRNKKYKFNNLAKILLFFLIIILCFNFNILSKNTFESKLSKLYNYNFNLLNEFENFKETEEFKKFCTNENCKFNIKNKHNLILIGDSHARTLLPGLFKFSKESDMGFISSIVPGCGFILNINRVTRKTGEIKYGCNKNKQLDRLKLINDNPESIIISFFRLPLILEESMFKSKLGYEGDFDDYIQDSEQSLKTKFSRQKFISDNIDLTIKKTLINGHYFIIIYPYPEVGVHVPKELIRLSKEIARKDKISKKDEFLNQNKIITDFSLFKERTNSSFKILSKINDKNVKRIYPHKLLCDNDVKNKCITHDNENIFYFDDDHPSNKGAEMINSLIIKKIKEITN